MQAARTLAAPTTALRPGDAVGALVVARVEPATGLAPDARTVFELRAAPLLKQGPVHVATAGAHAEDRDAPQRVAILIDVGESMSLPWDATRTRVQAAHDGLLAHLRAMHASAKVTLFTFARDTRLVAGPFPPAALAKGTVDLPAPKGPARLAGAIDAALAHLASQAGPARAEILVLTDGAGDPAALRRSVARARRLHVALSAWVFAPDVDALFAEAAHDTGGRVEQAALPLSFGDPTS